MRLAFQAVSGVRLLTFYYFDFCSSRRYLSQPTTSTTRALCESNTSPNDQQGGVRTNSAPLSYSLYPFSPPRPLSWKLFPTTAFRLRRVGHWLDMDLVHDSVGLARLAKEDGSVLLLDNE
jgi:hypothetical protein